MTKPPNPSNSNGDVELKLSEKELEHKMRSVPLKYRDPNTRSSRPHQGDTVTQFRTKKNKHVFGGNREKAIQRDGEKCIKCGMTRQEHRQRYGFDITVDHIDNMGTGKPEALRNSSLSNLQTLCCVCHGKKDNVLAKRYKGSKHWASKLTEDDVRNIRKLIKTGMRSIDIAKLYPSNSVSTIRQIKSGQTWSHLV